MRNERKINRVNFDKYNDENKKGFDLITLDIVSPNKFENLQIKNAQSSTWEKAFANSSIHLFK